MSDKNTSIENADHVQNVEADLTVDSVRSLKSVPQEEFSWDEDADYSKEERARMEEVYSSTLSVISEKQIVGGTVVSIGEKEVVLNIGFKSEGVVPISEFRDKPDLKPGDQVDVYLETVEDKKGQLVLSYKRANAMRTWEKIKGALEEDLTLEGIIRKRTKGGFVVDIDGIEAFLPGSQIDVKPVRDFDAYLGRKMEFKVVKINYPHDNVVISHKVLIEKDIEAQKGEILQNLEKGQVLEGTVKNMTNFGVFIDLGGLDGLLHITDISWGRINHPEEVLKLDEKINVVVLDFDDEKKRISLGLKQLMPHPWDSLPEDITTGSKVKGKVVTVAEYGLFLEIMPGVEGLIHMSEMSWSQHSKNPTETYKQGDEVEATVLSIDREERKMSLGLKQSTEDPWLLAPDKYPVGSRHTGIVRSLINVGLIVELEEGVDGLVHISDLSWTKKIKHPSEFTKKDEPLEVVVLSLDVESRRMSLGHKQMFEDPWDTFETIFVVGSTHSGTLTKMVENGATVELEYGVEGYVKKKDLTTPKGTPALKVGDASEFVVTEFQRDAKRIVLSHTRTWKEGEEALVETAPASSGDKKERKPAAKAVKLPPVEKSTLGDIEGLAALKANLEAEEKGTKAKAAPKAKAKVEESAPVAEATEVEVPAAESAPEADASASTEAAAE
jgi:small subunit ribosomal protein S1